eukprot:736284-Hanusia_phi.AAC.2
MSKDGVGDDRNFAGGQRSSTLSSSPPLSSSLTLLLSSSSPPSAELTSAERSDDSGWRVGVSEEVSGLTHGHEDHPDPPELEANVGLEAVQAREERRAGAGEGGEGQKWGRVGEARGEG